MPTVPSYGGQQAAPSGLAAGPFAAPQPLNAAPQQLQQAGDALSKAGTVGANVANDIQMMANQVRVDAALNQVRQQQQALTYDPQNGYLAKRGAAALDPDPLDRLLPQQYGEQLTDVINKAAEGLANDDQRRVFTQQAAQIHTQFSAGVESHMLQEYRSFGLETQQGTIKLAADAARRNWSNPDIIASQVKSAQAAVWKAGQISGEPGNLTEAKIKETTSAIHAGVIQAALDDNNPAYALGYIDSKKNEMTADDLLRANALVKADMRARVATTTAQNAMSSLQSKLAPTDTDQVLNITMQSESGGDRDALGRFVPGQGQAKGSMQVMDATNVAPGYGVAPAKDNSPEERVRVGRDYMLAMVKNYGGDLAKAWAAYNAGPGKVDDAIAQAKKVRSNWLTLMPQETQDYVAKNQAAYQKAAVPQLPSQQDVHDSIRQQLGPNADPRVLKAALDEGTRLYTDFMADRKTRGESAVLAAQQWLVQNGGNMAGMPASLSQQVTQYAPDKFDNLIDFGRKVAGKDNVKTNMVAYLDAVANTEELAKMPQSVFNDFVQKNFSSDDGKHIAALRQAEIDGADSNGSGALNRPALNMALNSRLEAIGINPTPKSLEEKARVGSIQKFVTDGIFAQQKQLGRKMTAQEVSEYVDQTMSRNVAFRNTFLGMTTSSNQQPLMGMRVSDIPSESLTGVRAALARAGNTRPTDDQILRTYWTSKNAK
jgi:soluble lytic murein transglycosylase